MRFFYLTAVLMFVLVNSGKAQLTTSFTIANKKKGIVTVNDNFHITLRRIQFAYNQYEVAAYAVGMIYVLIPYKELTPYLKPAFKKRMGLKPL